MNKICAYSRFKLATTCTPILPVVWASPVLSYLDVNLITKYLAHSLAPSHSLVMGRSLITMLPLLALSHQNLHLDTSTTTVKKQQQQQQQRSPARHVSTSAIRCLVFCRTEKKPRKIMQKVEGRDAELVQKQNKATESKKR